MRNNFLSAMFVLSLVTAGLLLGGCGSAKKEGANDPIAEPARVDEANCTNACHAAAKDPVNNGLIVAAWESSLHNTNSFNKVQCQDCHGNGGNHFGLGPIPSPNPDSDGLCFACHKTYLPAAHFYVMTEAQSDPDAVAPAMYVSKNYENSCTSCHDPHKADQAIGQEHEDWAESGHGDVNGVAWATEDFKENASCIRCHTATGYINYVTSGFTLPTDTWATEGDHTREVLTCKACHTSYDFGSSVRAVAQFTAPYTDAPTQYPNIGQSNLCIACHTGRQSGDSIKNSTSDFSNVSFKNSHYLTAGGIVFSKSGYHYGTRNYDSNIDNNGAANDYPHDNLGVSATGETAADDYIAANGLSQSGPCVVCHLNSMNLGRSSSHTFSPFTEYSGGDVALNPVCVNCHGSRGAGSNAKVAWFEATWKVRLDAALDALKDQLALKGIYFQNQYPYFFQADLTTAFKNWGADATTGKNNMGAAFNYNMLVHDPGAVAHNRYYSRRLIYDAIDWLDDGLMNFSVFATLNALGADKTYKANAITFLINRGTGDVNVGTDKERY